MQIDVSEPRSRAFNVFLRFFQLGLSLAATVFIAEFVTTSCRSDQLRLIELLCLILAGFNFLSLIYLRCKDQFPKCGFVFIYLLNLALSAAIFYLSLKGYQQAENCGSSALLHRYYIMQIPLYVLLSLAILVLPFYWVQRFSNSPGNLVWIVLFCSFSWAGEDLLVMLSIGLLSLLACVSTWTFNLVAGCKGISTGMKCGLVVGWVLSLLFVLGAEGLGVFQYITRGDNQSYHSLAKKTLLQVFLVINLIDINFWLFGFLTLRHENGDSIRDDLVHFGKDDHFQDID